jgi:hypothetical protein
VFSAKPFKISFTEICRVTSIPPFKSNPLLSSLDFALLYVVNPKILSSEIESK